MVWNTDKVKSWQSERFVMSPRTICSSFEGNFRVSRRFLTPSKTFHGLNDLFNSIEADFRVLPRFVAPWKIF